MNALTPQPGIEEIKERMRLVTYKPRYNGVFNSRLAHLPRRDPKKIDIATRTLKETPSYSRSAVAALA